MAAVLNHMIRNAVLDFQFNGNTDGIALQYEVKDWFWEFTGSLEKELNGLSFKNEVITINELELVVDLKGTDWKQEASHKILEQLKDRLRLIKSGSVSSPGYVEMRLEQYFANIFLYYLQNGYLPWQVSAISILQWNKDMEFLMKNGDETFLLQLKNLLAQSPGVRERFLHTVPFQSFLTLFQTFHHQRPAGYQDLFHDLPALMKIAIIHRHIHLQQDIYNALLKNLADNADFHSVTQQLEQSIHKTAMIYPTIIESVAGIHFKSQWAIALQKELSAKEKSQGSKTKVRKSRLLKKEEEEVEALEYPPIGQLPINEPVFISNAGLVVMAAFLPSLFERTKLSTDNKIKNTAYAVCLANYVVTGRKNMEEFELVLPKILSGVPVSRPVNTRAFHVNKSVKKEVDEVLASVIEHWSILKNTSVEGLRDSFLKRKGKLVFDGEKWVLQVEQQPYDMLLQHLPWNISLIKLPWMDHLLKTEWIY